jgi:protein-disulfide isomerase
VASSNTLRSTNQPRCRQNEEAEVKRDDLVRILAIVGGAIVLVVALVVATRIGNHSKKPSASNIQIGSVNEMLRGIPQKGIELGNPKAKLTMVEFADPQCPACGDFSRNTLPTIIQDYVRTGKLRIEYQGQHFLDSSGGPRDSERMLRLAQAAGLQNKLWNVVELEYENQGTENTGYATDPLLRGIVKAVPGLDVNEVFAKWNTSAVVPNMDTAKALANKAFKTLYTPSFLLGSTGSKSTVTIVGAQPISAFTKAINAQLKK